MASAKVKEICKYWRSQKSDYHLDGIRQAVSGDGRWKVLGYPTKDDHINAHVRFIARANQNALTYFSAEDFQCIKENLITIGMSSKRIDHK